MFKKWGEKKQASVEFERERLEGRLVAHFMRVAKEEHELRVETARVLLAGLLSRGDLSLSPAADCAHINSVIKASLVIADMFIAQCEKEGEEQARKVEMKFGGGE